MSERETIEQEIHRRQLAQYRIKRSNLSASTFNPRRQRRFARHAAVVARLQQRLEALA